MTIKNPETIVRLLKNQGVLEETQTARVYQYKCPDNSRAFAIFLSEETDDIYQSPYVEDPVLLHEGKRRTKEGTQFLKDFEAEAERRRPKPAEQEFEIPSF